MLQMMARLDPKQTQGSFGFYLEALLHLRRKPLLQMMLLSWPSLSYSGMLTLPAITQFNYVALHSCLLINSLAPLTLQGVATADVENLGS
jgi:hypothetical protein